MPAALPFLSLMALLKNLASRELFKRQSVGLWAKPRKRMTGWAGAREQVVIDVVHCTWQSIERDKLKGKRLILSRCFALLLCHGLSTFVE